MNQIIYGDILFLINFSMDFLSLFLTGKILHNKMHTALLTFSASIGAIYAIVSLFLKGNSWILFGIHVAVSLLMCFIAFPRQTGKGFVKASTLFYAVTFLLGGGITALYSLFNSYWKLNKINFHDDATIAYSEIPPGIFILCAIVCAAFSFLFGKLFQQKGKLKSVSITAVYKNTSVTFDGLPDTGNFLADPISGKPVIITKYSFVKNLIPHEIQSIYVTKDTSHLEELSFPLLKRIRIIPMTGVGHTGLLIGFVPDKVTLCYGHKCVEKEAILAIDTEETSYEGYASILPAVLLD